eukprot:Seg768.4 transcript_id=Seg768.4/GoldUCD/mRNA.D3Y31 product="hypothetical protein" protein_id=Seg768.4/GoldUCD/D3Y31
MSLQKKLADEAYANEYVIHQNACADRKLQRELRHLERLQETQRRRLEQSSHYFDVLHKVVPMFDPLNEPERKEKMAHKKPLLQKRHTEPSLVTTQLMNDVKSRVRSETKLTPRSVKSQKEITCFKGNSEDVSYNSQEGRTEHKTTRNFDSGNGTSLFNFNHINQHANEQPSRNALDRNHQTTERKSRHIRTRHLSNFQSNEISQGDDKRSQGDEREGLYPPHNFAWRKSTNHSTNQSTNQQEEFYVQGRVSHLNKKISEKSGSHQKGSPVRRSTDLMSKSQSIDGINSKNTFDRTTTSDSLSIRSFSTEHGCNDTQSQRAEFKERSSSVSSNQSDGDPSNEEDETLPAVSSDKVALRISGDKSKKLKMLYQLRDGHVEVPQAIETRTISRKIERNGESITIEDLSLRKRSVQKSVSLDSNAINRRQNNSKKTTQNIVNGAQMTFVKFLPKSRQASYLRNDTEYPRRLCNSWHAGQSTHF